MSSTIKIPAMPDPEVIDRHLPTGITLRGFTKKQLAARDAQWQESAGIVAKALTGMLERYVSLVNSGDAGHWDCETEPEVIAARAALSAITEE